MARRLNATDAYLIMKNLVKQATGETVELVSKIPLKLSLLC